MWGLPVGQGQPTTTVQEAAEEYVLLHYIIVHVHNSVLQVHKTGLFLTKSTSVFS